MTLAERQTPALVLHGGRDDRIPLAYTDEAIALLRAEGASIQLGVIDEADHFLLFTHRREVGASVGEWLDRVGYNRN